MNYRIPSARDVHRLFFSTAIIGGAIFAIALCLMTFSSSAGAQSGRKSPPTAKPSPSQSSAESNSDQDDQTATNGKVEGGETIEGDTLTVNTALVSVPVTVM